MDANLNRRPAVSFVVPCYNEAKNIAGTIEEIEAAAREDEDELPSFEVVVVNDCSTDDTGAVVAALAQHKAHLRLVSNAVNLGFGGSYKEGIKNASGFYVIMVPGDNAHPRDGITPILRLAGKADIIIPYVANFEARAWPRRVASYCFTGLMNTLFSLDVPYFNGLVLHRTDLLQQIEIETNGFAYQAEALVKLIRGGASFVAVPVTIAERVNSTSSAFKPKNVYRVLRTIVTLWISVRRIDRRRAAAGRRVLAGRAELTKNATQL